MESKTPKKTAQKNQHKKPLETGVTIYNQSELTKLQENVKESIDGLVISTAPLVEIFQSIESARKEIDDIIANVGQDDEKLMEYEDTILKLKSRLVKFRTGPEADRAVLVKPYNDLVAFINNTYKKIVTSVQPEEAKLKPLVEKINSINEAEKKRKEEEKQKKLTERTEAITNLGAKMESGYYVVRQDSDPENEVSLQISDLQTMSDKTWEAILIAAKKIHDTNTKERDENARILAEQQKKKQEEEEAQQRKAAKELEDLRMERLEARSEKMAGLGFELKGEVYYNPEIGSSEHKNKIADLTRDQWNEWCLTQTQKTKDVQSKKKEADSINFLNQHNFIYDPKTESRIRTWKNTCETMSIHNTELETLNRESILVTLNEYDQKEQSVKSKRENNHNQLINAGMVFQNQFYTAINRSIKTPEFKIPSSILDSTQDEINETISKFKSHTAEDMKNKSLQDEEEKKARDLADLQEKSERELTSKLVSEIEAIINKYENVLPNKPLRTFFLDFRKKCESNK